MTLTKRQLNKVKTQFADAIVDELTVHEMRKTLKQSAKEYTIDMNEYELREDMLRVLDEAYVNDLFNVI